MIKVYFDWNVLSQIKNGYQKELETLLNETDRLFIPYSSSHIGDILASYKETDEQKQIIESDLDFLEKYTQCKYLYNDGKDVKFEFYSPHFAFKQKLEETNTFKYNSPLEIIENSFNEMDDYFSNDTGKALLCLYKSIPISTILDLNSENSEELNKFFPGIKENPTLEGLMQGFSQFNKNLNESDDYKDLRNTLQTGLGINRDKIFDTNNPYKIIGDAHKKLENFDLSSINKNQQEPKWFSEIMQEYVLLDIHGYQEDKINIEKGRKETFRNTTEDALHAAFAATCSFYVINDNKAYKKTKQVYEKLNINTLVLKPNEFVEFYTKYLGFNDDSLVFGFVRNIINNGEFYEDETEDSIFRTYFFPYFLFDFFNKIIVVLHKNGDNETILLSQNGPIKKVVYSMEVMRLYKKLSAILGNDDDNFGEVKDEEFKNCEWIGRKWTLENIIIRLVCPNGHFQLYLDC